MKAYSANVRIMPEEYFRSNGFLGDCVARQVNVFLVEVVDRNAKTLMAAISENIATGSIIYSDNWRPYKTDEWLNAGFQHFKVNHRYNFIDPETSIHTQTIERLWGSAKWRNECHRGTARHYLKSYLSEFIWRREVGEEDVFYYIFAAMK